MFFGVIIHFTDRHSNKVVAGMAIQAKINLRVDMNAPFYSRTILNRYRPYFSRKAFRDENSIAKLKPITGRSNDRITGSLLARKSGVIFSFQPAGRVVEIGLRIE